MQKKILLAILLIIVISMAGCLKGDGGGVSTPTSYPGVTISEFYPVAPQAYAGSVVTLYARAQNNGYFDAENVKLKLYNCGNINTGVRESTGDDYNCNAEIDLSARLLKPDWDLGIVGDSAEEQFAMTSPTFFPEGRTPHTFNLRLTYDYRATASRDVVFTTFDNWREKSGKIEAGQLNIMSTPAPVQATINAPGEPIIITETNLEQPFTVSVNLRNTGSGYVANDRTLDRVELCYPSDFVTPIQDSETCTDFQAPQGNCLVATDVSLIGLTNQWVDLGCSFKINENAVTVQDVATFTATADYTYSIDSTTQVILIG